MTEHDFDWEDYFDLAIELKDNYYGEAYFRTIISRFYYASFGVTRKYLIENKIFRNKYSNKILKSKSHKVHSEVLKILKDNNVENRIPEHKQLYNYLNKLRRMRNVADYDCDVKIDDDCVEYYLYRTKIILEILDK